MKNFGQLKEAAQQITPPHADVGIFINNSMVDLVKFSERERRASLSVSAGKITFPDDYLYLRSVGYKGSPLNIQEGRQSPDHGTGSPRSYMEQDDGIYLFPVPADESSIDIVYCPRPATLVNDEDIPELKDADEAIIAYAKWKIYTAKEDFAAAEYWRDEYAAEKMSWLALDGMRNKRVHRVRTQQYR